jgi:hypothetical protein
VRRDAADNFVVDPVAIRTGANALLKQLIVESVQEKDVAPIVNTVNYDVNGNGKLDIWKEGVPIPAGEANEAFLLGLGTTWPELKDRIIYVSYPIRRDGIEGDPVRGVYYPLYNVTFLWRHDSHAVDEVVLAHELGHACNLSHVSDAPNNVNQKHVMRFSNLSEDNIFFGYFRVRRKEETGVTPGFDEQWNKVIR